MAEQNDEPESASGPHKPEPEAESAEPGDAASAEAREAETADATDATDPVRSAPAEAVSLVPSRPKKKKKRAADAVPEPIRDRNRRLREEAASKREGRVEQRRAPARAGLEAGEMVDDAFARTSQAAGEWLKKNFNVVQWLLLALIVGWIGYAVYSYRAGRNAEQQSAKLTSALRAEDGRIGSDDSKPDPRSGIVDTRVAYTTDEARLRDAEKQYRAIAEASSQSPAATFAKLGLASVLYDQSKFADAKAAYQAVKDSKLAGQDLNVKGRALEGLGITFEALGDAAGAQKAFGELSNLNGFGFRALGAYHKARLAFAAGDADKAKELLKEAQKQLDASADKTDKTEPKTPGNPGYLESSVRELLRRIDPNAVTAAPNALTADQLQELEQQMGSPGAGPGGKGMSQEQLNELLKRLSKPGSKAPAPPTSAP